MTHHRRRNNGTDPSKINETVELSPAQRYAAFKQTQAKQRTVAAEFARSMPFELDEFQMQANDALEAGDNVLVAAPTGAGKNVAAALGEQASRAQPISPSIWRRRGMSKPFIPRRSKR